MAIASFMRTYTPWVMGFLCCGWPLLVFVFLRNWPSIWEWLNTIAGDDE